MRAPARRVTASGIFFTLMSQRRKQFCYAKSARRVDFQENENSTRLREAESLLRTPRAAEGLAILNDLARVEDPRLATQVVSASGDAFALRGELEDAISAYRNAVGRAPQSGDAWLRPTLALIRSHLSQGQLAEANSEAGQALAGAQSREASFAASLRVAAGQLTVDVPAKPVPYLGVAAKVARTFSQQGYHTEAKAILTALGPVEVRCVLAELAKCDLATGDYAAAYDRGLRALAAGKYAAKTVALWELVAAAAKAGGGDFSPNLLSRLDQAKPAIKARSYVVIARAARRHGFTSVLDAVYAWANATRVQYPTQTAEIFKMQAASLAVARNYDPAGLSALLLGLLRSEALSPGEFVAAAKQLVQTRLAAGLPDPAAEIMQIAQSSTKPGLLPRTLHGLGLLQKRSGQNEAARMSLLSAFNASAVGSAESRRAAWSLSGVEQSAGQTTAAADWMARIAFDAEAPAKFRNLAKLRWLSLVGATDEAANARHLESIRLEFPACEDAAYLYSVARQTKRLGSLGRQISAEALERALTLTGQQVEIMPMGKARLKATLPMVRGLIWHDRHAEVLPIYDAFAQSPAAQPESEEFAELQASAFWSLVATRQETAAVQFSAAILGSPQVTRVQEGWMGESAGSYYLMWLENPTAALAFFRRALTAFPSLHHNAKSAYWLGLSSVRAGDLNAGRQLLQSALALLPDGRGYRWQRRYRTKALAILAQLPSGQFSEAAIADERVRQSVSGDLRLISR